MIDKLYTSNCLTRDEMLQLLNNLSSEDADYLHERARLLTDQVFGRKIYIRGLIEFTNYCSRNCVYCGIRKDNTKVQRYRLSEEDVLKTCAQAHELGFRTFVLQGGEDHYYHNDKMVSLVKKMNDLFPDTATTLSIGERDAEIYAKLYENGANRFLLRHETIDKNRYAKLHPGMSFDERMECIQTLRTLNFQTGVGFLIGLPEQKITDYVDDLMFIKDFNPHMVGIGPFISHKDTPLGGAENGDVKTTLIMLSIIRLLLPKVLLPSTTALNTLSKDGSYSGFNAGANVLMLNLTPSGARENYNLYEGKTIIDISDGVNLNILKENMRKKGYILDMSRGDYNSSMH
ncbi:MAG: [FeFe] hydrogenase H-cluster radical SAM maturase HydE [Kiritimatiellae bacterium]|nr:[FeFe] hydrogenase H-cluster radical SAM maturase HydE [Kiritimatiellia bacterium]